MTAPPTERKVAADLNVEQGISKIEGKPAWNSFNIRNSLFDFFFVDSQPVALLGRFRLAHDQRIGWTNLRA